MQNDSHLWLSHSFRVHQIGLPRWGSLQRSPDLLVGLRGTYYCREERERGGKGREWKRRLEEGKGIVVPGAHPIHISGYTTASITKYTFTSANNLTVKKFPNTSTRSFMYSKKKEWP